MLHIIKQSNFEEKVLQNDKPILLDFWASWCGPCKMLSPIIEELANEHDEFDIGKVNVDEEQVLAMKFKVAAIPTVMVFKNGIVTATNVGFASKQELLSLLK